MKCREDLSGGEAKIEAFLTDLAVNAKVAPATQNQAMNALVFLYRRVLKVPLGQAIDAVRAERRRKVPVVLTRDETARVIPMVEGVAGLVVRLMYGSGLRIMEALRLRVKDIDFQMRQVTVRSGKGDKDRVSTFARSLTALFEEHLLKVKIFHELDLAKGHGAVWLPYALERKYPKASREWAWQWMFPAREVSLDPLSGVTRRHHVDASVVNKAIKAAVGRAGLVKVVSTHTFSKVSS